MGLETTLHKTRKPTRISNRGGRNSNVEALRIPLKRGFYPSGKTGLAESVLPIMWKTSCPHYGKTLLNLLGKYEHKQAKRGATYCG